METATFEFKGRQISLKIDKATPNLIVRLLRVSGYDFALNSEEGACIKPLGEEHFSELLKPGTIYTVLDFNDNSANPRSSQSDGEVIFVHEDESGRELVWKTSPQGLTFDRIASHFPVKVESMILIDSEGRPFDDAASLQLQNGMTYQVYGDPAPHRPTSDTDYSQVSSFHMPSSYKTMYQEKSDRSNTCRTINLQMQMDYDKAMAMYDKQIEREMCWNGLTSLVNVAGVIELLIFVRLSLHRDFDLSNEFTFSFEAVNDKDEIFVPQTSARKALYDVCASIQKGYDFMRNKMNEMAAQTNLISSHVFHSMELKPNSKNRDLILGDNNKVLEDAGQKCSEIAEETVYGIKKTIKYIEQLASCLVGESVTERKIWETKDKKRQKERQLLELSEERPRVVEMRDQSLKVVEELREDYEEKSKMLSSWELWFFGWQGNSKLVYSRAEKEEDLFLGFLSRLLSSPLPGFGQLQSKKLEKIAEYELTLKSHLNTSSLKIAVSNFVEKLKNVTDEESYAQLKDLEKRMKVQHDADRSAKNLRDKRKINAKTFKEQCAVDADIANDYYQSALHMQENYKKLAEDSLRTMNVLQRELSQMDRDLKEEDLVGYLKQSGESLQMIKNLMMHQATVFRNLKTKIEVDLILKIKDLCLCFTLTAGDCTEVKEIYNRLQRRIFEVGCSSLVISSYARVYTKIDQKHIMGPMTEILIKSVQCPSLLSKTYTENTTEIFEQDLKEQLAAIREEVADKIKPFCKKFDIEVAIDE